MSLHTSEVRLIQANQAYWRNGISIANGEKWIYVLHTLTTAKLPCILENIVAKGLQEKEQLPIVSVVSGKKNEFLDRLDESFGIEQRFHSSYHEFDSDAEKKRVEQLAQGISFDTYGNKDKLIALTYRGIAYGDAVYDDILRRGKTGKRGEVFDCFDISRERYFVFIRNALTVIDKAYKLFGERRPSYLVTAEYVFTKGLYASVASALGAKIIFSSIDAPGILMQIEPSRCLLQNIKVADILKSMRQNFFQRYKQEGTGGGSYFLMTASDETPKQTMRAKVKGEEKRKTVFILPHALCDAPRQACRHNIYHDYNEWLSDTLRIIRDIPDVDWIMKDHPLAACYGQCDYVRSVFENNRAPNIYLYEKNYSGMNIKDIADAVITCAGDAGIEYWAYGIPTITTADAYYCDWGISYQMRSLAEYEDTLRHIQCIAPPPSESIESAKKYIQASKNQSDTEDLLVTLFYNFRERERRIFKTDGVYFENNDWSNTRLEISTHEFCESYVKLLQMSNLRTSAIYRLTNMWDV